MKEAKSNTAIERPKLIADLAKLTRRELIDLLNEDLARAYRLKHGQGTADTLALKCSTYRPEEMA